MTNENEKIMSKLREDIYALFLLRRNDECASGFEFAIRNILNVKFYPLLEEIEGKNITIRENIKMLDEFGHKIEQLKQDKAGVKEEIKRLKVNLGDNGIYQYYENLIDHHRKNAVAIIKDKAELELKNTDYYWQISDMVISNNSMRVEINELNTLYNRALKVAYSELTCSNCLRLQKEDILNGSENIGNDPMISRVIKDDSLFNDDGSLK